MPAFFFVPERSRHATDSARWSSGRRHRAAKRAIYSGRFRVPVCEASAFEIAISYRPTPASAARYD